MLKYFRAFALSFVAILTLTISLNPVTVFAEAPSELVGKYIGNSLLTTNTEVEDTTTVLTRGNILNKGTAKCTNAGNGEVIATGITLAHQECDNIRMVISLDQLDAGEWYTYDSWDVSKQNANMFMKSFTVPVEKGYFYRVRGSHVAEKGDVIESVETCTDGLWIE